MHPEKLNNPRKNRDKVYLGVASIIFGLVVLYLSGDASLVPDRSVLVNATGPFQSATKTKSSVKFSLKGETRHFQHLSKSGNFLPIYQALSDSGGKMISVLYDPAQGWQRAFDDNTYHTVYEIRISDQILLSYEQTREAWQADQNIGKALGITFLLIGAVFVIYARLR